MSSTLDGFLDSISALAGMESNFVDPQTVASSLIAVNSIFLPLMLIAVTIRIYIKSCIVHAMGWDDWKYASLHRVYLLSKRYYYN